METHLVLATIFLCFTAYTLVARRLEASILSGPMMFTGLGYALFSIDPTLMAPRHNALVEFLVTATLVIILFRDAANIRIPSVMAQRATALLSVRLLFIGIPLTVLAGTIAGLALFPALGLFGALVLAIILTPTDAALAQPIFGNRDLPEIEREALDVESGLNDGLCLPLLLVALALAASTGSGEGMAGHATFFAKQVVFGPVTGVLIGYLGSLAVGFAFERGLSRPAGETPIMVTLAGLAYVCAEVIGGNGFLAAFCAGLAFGWRLPAETVAKASHFAVTEGAILTNLTFLIFGAVMLPIALDAALAPTLFYAVVSLTVVRMLPVFVAMLGTETSAKARLFVGWFGPRGLASVLYLLLVVDESGFYAAGQVTDIAVITILLSVILHGVSASFAQRAFFPERA